MEEFTTTVLPPELQDVRDLPKLTALLLKRGLSADEVDLVLGTSSFRFFAAVLPRT